MRLAGSEQAAGRAPSGLLLGLSLAQLISWGSTFYLFGLLVQPIELALHIDRTQSALAFSLMLLAEGAAALPVGRWIDRGHARRVMCGGSVLVAACLLAHTQVSHLMGFYAVWACLGVALAGVLYTPVFAVVTRRFPLDFRRAIITLTFLGGLASTVFIPLMQWSITGLGWRPTLMWLACLHVLVCLPLHAYFLRGELPQAAVAARAVAASMPLKFWLRSPVFWLIGIFTALGMAVTSSLPAHLVPLLQEQHLPAHWVVLVPAGIGALQVCGRILLYRLEGGFDVHQVNLGIVLLMPVSLLLLAGLLVLGHTGQATTPLALALALGFAALYGMANGMLTIVKGTAVAQYVDRAQVAALNGVLGLPTALARALTPALVGALWGVSQGYGWGVALLWSLSVLSCAAFALAQRLAHRERLSI
ncbi:MAG: hypothetical protein RLZZ401_1039 [Pseudomonadota bacterium]|jgi:MFS family permease